MNGNQATEQGSRLYVYMISIVAAVGGFLFGYDLNVFNGAVNFLEKAFELNGWQLGLAGCSAMIGCIFGPICGGWMADWVGRRKTLMISAILFGVSAIGTAMPLQISGFLAKILPQAVLDFEVFNLRFFSGFGCFNIFRFIGGLGVGLSSVVSPMYIAEISPARIRGRLVTLNQFAIVFGSLCSIIVSYLLVKYLPASAQHLNWNFIFGSECVPIVIFVFALFLIPRSPRWLMQKGREREAGDVLKKIDGPEHAATEVKVIKEVLQEESGGYRELFLPGIRIALLIGILLAFFQQWVGGTPLTMFASRIFVQAGFDEVSSLQQSIILNVFNIFCVILAMYVLDRFGRRPLMLIGTSIMAVGMILLGFAFQFGLKKATLPAMLIPMLAYQASMGPITWLIISEIFPTNARAKGMGVAAVVLWIAAVTSTFAYPVIQEFSKNTFGHTGSVFWLYAVVCILAFIFGLTMIPETKGKTLEEIAKSWLRRKKDNNG